MELRPIPFLKMVYVCTHARENESACANPERGENSGFLLVDFLRAEVKRRNLKSKVRVVKSGCLDVCAQGPNVMIFTQDAGAPIWHKNIRKEDWSQLAESIFQDFSSNRTF